jgi:hypothetical protein
LTDLFDSQLIKAFAWVFLWLAASLIYRRSRGKPIFYRKRASVKFRQSNASGNSHRTWYTRIGGASNCLVVQVTENELDIHPSVPFNWLFLPEIYGLEYKIPLDQIVSAHQVKKIFREMIELEFRTKEGKIEGISLWLKRPDDFLAAIGRSGVVHNQPVVD